MSPFSVLLGDTICESENGKPVLDQLINTYSQYKSSVTSIEEVPTDLVNRYGIMGGEEVTNKLHKVDQWVEKPKPHLAPSRLAIAGRYVFTPAIFQCLENIERGFNNEVQLTDAMRTPSANRDHVWSSI